MNAWHEFLTEQGATWQNDGLCAFDGAGEGSAAKLIPMVEHEMLQINGADAAKFLQGQCTCDIRELEQQKVLLGAHCNRQGRMLSSFTVTGLTDSVIGLRLRRNIAMATLNELKRYIVFSKASISASPWVGLAILNANTANSALAHLPQAGLFSADGDSVVIHHTFGLIEIWTDVERAKSLWKQLAEDHQLSPPNQLDLCLVENGITEIQALTQERFIPQDLNYQAIHGINFKKGCYTGQEIVARMQYRAQLKKHCYRLVTDSTILLKLGTPLYSPGDPEKKVAEVVACAPSTILVVATEDAVAAATHLVELETETNFTWAKLPYAIP